MDMEKDSSREVITFWAEVDSWQSLGRHIEWNGPPAVSGQKHILYVLSLIVGNCRIPTKTSQFFWYFLHICARLCVFLGVCRTHSVFLVGL